MGRSQLGLLLSVGGPEWWRQMLRVMAGCDAHVSCLVGDNGYFRVGKLMIGDCRSSMSCDWHAVFITFGGCRSLVFRRIVVDGLD